MNGLSGSSVIRTRNIQNGLQNVRREWHEHPQTGEIVVLDTWSVPDGECVSFESEVVEVIPRARKLADCIRGLEMIYQRLDAWQK